MMPGLNKSFINQQTFGNFSTDDKFAIPLSCLFKFLISKADLETKKVEMIIQVPEGF